MNRNHRILITGASGYIGNLLYHSLRQRGEHVWGIDLRPAGDVIAMDIRDDKLGDFCSARGITHVVHLASIVQPGMDAALEYDIDVNGTKNVLNACVATGVRHLTVTSSGAAYGYHADNPDWIDEQQPLRGNDSFSYSRHKRLVEELMAEYRQQHPQLAQLVFRPGTVVGAETANMITRLFSGRFVLGLRGCRSPFVFIWDQDLVDLLADGVARSVTGIYNVAGDGAVTLREIGEILGKPVLEVPIWFLKVVLSITKPLRITRYGPDQIMFMQYRPVLSNHKLRTEFGHRLKKSSREAFEYFARHVKE